MSEIVNDSPYLAMIERPNDWEMPEKITLAYERQIMRSQMAKILDSLQPLVYVFNQPTGLGKTTIMLESLRQLLATGWPKRADGSDIRILFLTKTHSAISEIREMLPEAHFVEGRSDDPESPFYCDRKSKVEALAKKFQSQKETNFCNQCIAEHKQVAPDWKCPYLSSMKQAKDPLIVIAPYASYLNFSDRISAFDVVIVDEELPSQLVKPVEVRMKDLDAWLNGMETINAFGPTGTLAYPEAHPAKVFISALKRMVLRTSMPKAAKAADPTHLPPTEFPEQSPFGGLIKHEVGPQSDLVFQYLTTVASAESNDLDFEHPTADRAPMRVFKELAQAIIEDKGAAQVANGVLSLCIPLRKAINELGKKVVINLDATPNFPLLREIFGDKVKRSFNKVPDLNIRVAQFPCYIYSSKYLKDQNYRLLAELETHIEYCIGGYEHPLIVASKDFVDTGGGSKGKRHLMVSHEDAKIIYFGNETRSLNNFQDRDCVVIAGNWSENLDSIKRRVAALRRSNPLPRRSHDEYVSDLEGSGSYYKPYFQPYRESRDLVLARERPGIHNEDNEQDALTLACFEHALAAEVIQAIGRARPLQREFPLDVYIINGAVYEGIPINRFISRKEVIDIQPIVRPDSTQRNLQRAEKYKSLCESAYEDGCSSIKEVQEYLMARHGKAPDPKTIRKHLPQLRQRSSRKAI